MAAKKTKWTFPELDQRLIKRGLLGAFALFIALLFIYALMPSPVLVDTEMIGRGPLEVTVDEEGETRIREVYTVSAPVGGKVLRAPREIGDRVEKNKTLVAVIQPVDPSFLDVRRRRELESAVAAAEAAVSHTRTQIVRAQAELRFAESEKVRAESLAQRGTVSKRTLEKAQMDVDVRGAELEQSRANLELRQRELESAKARLIGPQTRIDTEVNGENGFVEVFAPENGRVLKIQTESEQVVRPGEALLEIGDPNDLEIVVDLLSTDAVKVKQGAQAHVEGWGGGRELAAKVRRIDPAGFTKISALGIEEQRVNTVLDLVDPKENWQQLGHDFRVFVRVTVWKSDDVLRVPLSALFRSGDDWAVFKFEDDRAVLTPVKIGQRNSEHAEIIEGLDARDRVILHPSDRVADGVGVEERDQNRTSPSI